MLTDDLPHTDIGVDGIDASMWTAARHGMSARLLDPTSGKAEDAWLLADRLLAAIAPTLRELDDEDRVRDGIDRLRASGTGGDRQRRAVADGGPSKLAELLRAGTPSPLAADRPGLAGSTPAP